MGVERHTTHDIRPEDVEHRQMQYVERGGIKVDGRKRRCKSRRIIQ